MIEATAVAKIMSYFDWNNKILAPLVQYGVINNRAHVPLWIMKQCLFHYFCNEIAKCCALWNLTKVLSHNKNFTLIYLLNLPQTSADQFSQFPPPPPPPLHFCNLLSIDQLSLVMPNTEFQLLTFMYLVDSCMYCTCIS